MEIGIITIFKKTPRQEFTAQAEEKSSTSLERFGVEGDVVRGDPDLFRSGLAQTFYSPVLDMGFF